MAEVKADLPPTKGQTPGWGGVTWLRCDVCGEWTDMWLEVAKPFEGKPFTCRDCLIQKKDNRGGAF